MDDGTQGERRGLARAALVLAALLALFFSTPLARLGTGVYSTADLAQHFALCEIEPGHVPANKLTSDPPFQMQAWLGYAREELASGRPPLWNPYSGCGQPLVANYQSALFSPFHLPVLLFGLRHGLLIRAFLELFALGLLAYLFLRELRLSWFASLFGAAAFAFGGHNVVLVAYPHPGALVALVGGLWAAERALRASEEAGSPGALARAGRARVRSSLVGLALLFGAGALAGHPEPFFFAVLVVAAWCGARIAGMLLQRRATPAAAARLGLALAGAASLGFALAAIQVLPFVEYLGQSTAAQSRQHSQDPFYLRHAALWLFPDLLGSPARDYYPSTSLPPPNYEDVAMNYPGALALFLACLSLVWIRTERRLWFFAALAAVWFVWAHDLFGSARWLGKFPLLSKVPVNRSQPIWLLCVSAGAALAVERLCAAPRERGRPAISAAIAAAGLGFLALGYAAAEKLLAHWAQGLGPLERFDANVPGHVRAISLSFAAGLAGAALLPCARGARTRAALAALLLGAAWFQTGWSFRDYNPTVDERFFFPRTEALAELQRQAGDRTVAVLGDPALPAEQNAYYRISLLSNYDALSVLHFDKFAVFLFGSGGPLRDPRRASRNGLLAAGVEFVLTRGEWVRSDSELSEAMFRRQNQFTALELAPGADISQLLAPTHAGLQGAMVFVSARPTAAAERLTISLEEEPTQRVVAARELTGRELLLASLDPSEVNGSFDGAPDARGTQIVLAFPPETASAGRRYRLRLTATGAGFVAWGLREPVYPAGQLELGGTARPGTLLFDFSYGVNAFERIAALGRYRLHRYTDSLTRYFTVSSSLAVADDKDAISRLRDPAHDVGRTVLLSDAPAEHRDLAGSEPSAPAEILEERPGGVRLRVQRSEPGYLVAARTFFPGWKATVNGHSTPILRANLAFQAVPIPAGPSDIDLTYSPTSFYLGAAISLASAITIALLSLLARRASESPVSSLAPRLPR